MPKGYTKAQFLQSKRYAGVQRDILNVVLEDGKRYTHEQVEKAIKDFKKGKVL